MCHRSQHPACRSKRALVLVSLVAIGVALVNLRTIRTFPNFRPLVIRTDQLGPAEALDYRNFDYKPQDGEVRYFLTQFCTLYYRRNRYTIQNDFSKSLYFLGTSLANSVFDAYKKGDIIENFPRTPPRPRSTLMSRSPRRIAEHALPRPRGLRHGLSLARRSTSSRRLMPSLMDRAAATRDAHSS